MWLAALVTLVIPGFGQAVAERTRRAVVWAVGGAVALVVCWWLSIAWVVVAALHVGAAVDALWCLRRATKPAWDRNANFAVGLIGVAPLIAAAFVVRFYKIPSSAMYPTLEIGDHVAVDKVSSISRGDVIVFHFPCEHDRDYVKRVIGLAGDTVEVRCNVAYVNGTPIENHLVAGDCNYEDYDESRESWFNRSCSRYHEQYGGHAYDVFHDPDRPARDKLATHTDGDVRDFPRPEEPPSCRNSEMSDSAAPDLGKLVETKPGAGPCELHYHYVVPPHSLFVMGDNRNNSNDSRVWGSLDETAVVGRVKWIWWSRTKSRIGRID